MAYTMEQRMVCAHKQGRMMSIFARNMTRSAVERVLNGRGQLVQRALLATADFPVSWCKRRHLTTPALL